VGIAIEGQVTTSAGNWGSADIDDATGYSVIVRYGHLYVLYGHLIEVDRFIYVGKTVDERTRIGAIGIFPDSNPHLHIEVRSSVHGSDVYGQIMVIEDGKNNGNKHGILKIGGKQTNSTYDIAQFFTTSPGIYIQDYNSGATTSFISPLGAAIQHNSVVIFGATCEIRYFLSLQPPPLAGTPTATPIINAFTISATIGGTSVQIRSLQNGQINLQTGVNPVSTPNPASYQ
jgi:murein DD-endopeptidase MepM/ murein hydrolase activator NlpD